MAIYSEKVKAKVLPLLPVKDTVIFPAIPTSVEIFDQRALAALTAAKKDDANVFVITLTGDRSPSDVIGKVGVVCKVGSISHSSPQSAVAVLEGICRADFIDVKKNGDHDLASIACKMLRYEDDGVRSELLRRDILKLFEAYPRIIPNFSKELESAIRATKSPSMFSDLVASSVIFRNENKLTLLNEYDPVRRLELLPLLMESELVLLGEEAKIHKRTREAIEENQRDYYLREQLKVIKSELGEDEEYDEEIAEYMQKIADADLPDEVREKLVKETIKLSKQPYSSHESAVIRGYIDTCLELPWKKRTKDSLSVANARKILNADHDGIDDVKERILEFIAVKNLTPDIKNQIICLVGAPGVGKTSIGSSIARALGRKYVRVALGGVRDESDIRGHRKTYVGSMPGRIIAAINQAGVSNPLILLDEIDKLTRDSHGDPSSALLEVLDPDQNKSFRDHFIELPFDLSECMFIATANTLDTIPRPLLDRMEVIEMKSYSAREKLSIAKNHLIPKKLKAHGLTKKDLRIDDSAILGIIKSYTREAGVRNLEREIASICRKVARRIVEEPGIKKITVKASNLHEFLGGEKIIPEKISECDEIGVVNGLAYTDAGGDMLKVEVVSMPGSGKIELTGSLGEVMKESAKIALSIVRERASELGIESDFYKTKDIHIHFPEGAVPKDGPSAGVTLVCALISELGKYPARRDVAMTGEVSLRGKVLAIGGLREKSMAAYLAGVKRIFIPKDNARDIDKVDVSVRDNVEFVLCETVEDVIKGVLILPEKSADAENDSSIIPIISKVRPENLISMR
ncbi:MAG: endopeptidase La [Ruminococcaceae bacterium]|nr:endopeptidase La [Oscillospiraceae bacterium]